jgi:hypothetical protein
MEGSALEKRERCLFTVAKLFRANALNAGGTLAFHS